MRHELPRVVLEAEELVARGRVEARGELVLDPFPGGEVGGVLVAVFPDGAPGFEDGARGGDADLGGGGEAAFAEAEDHEGVGVGVEGVELGGDVWLRVDVVPVSGDLVRDRDRNRNPRVWDFGGFGGGVVGGGVLFVGGVGGGV